MKRIAIIAMALLLAACGQSLDGTYTDAMGMMKYTFQPDGKLYMGALGIKTELEYELEGDKIKVILADGSNQVMTLAEDGTIMGPLGMVLSKKDQQ